MNGFDALLRGACNSTETGVTVSARDTVVDYLSICNPNAIDNRAHYYDMTSQRDIDQCQFTWNWEMNGIRNNDKPGPFPNENSVSCQHYCFCCQTVICRMNHLFIEISHRINPYNASRIMGISFNIEYNSHMDSILQEKKIIVNDKVFIAVHYLIHIIRLFQM